MILILILIISATNYCHSSTSCSISIVESIPEDLTYMSTAYIAPPIWKTWVDLIASSKEYIKINSLYWSMLSSDTTTNDSSSNIGSKIFAMLIEKSKTVPILINHAYENRSCNDINILRQHKKVNVSLINVKKLAGSGIQHSKLLIGDGTRIFLGSANMDWRSLTQIKELGAYITNCNAINKDIEAFWNSINYLSGSTSKIPKVWPRSVWPKYNMSNPLHANVNGVPMTLYTATSPRLFNPPQRTEDLDAIINTINEAKKYILISVMDYTPLFVNFSTQIDKYWPDIEDAILAAAINKDVTVKMLISLWNYSSRLDLPFLKALMALKFGKIANIEVKFIIIPAFNKFQRDLPFSRVSHSKYMVTDSTGYIGTSNWTGNYFIGTIGLSLIAKENCGSVKCGARSIRKNMEDIFFTDWNSIYAHDI